MQYLALFLQQAPTPSPVMQFLPIIAIVLIFYFLVFMPMQKQKKQQAQLLAGLQSGNEVLTTGGIVGTIVNLEADNVIIRVKPDNIKLMIKRSAVAGLASLPAAEEKK